MTAAIRILGLGPVVGARTWGGVIGIDAPLRPGGRHRDDGAALRHLVRGLRLGLENHGVDPDVEVLIPPQDWAAGRDVQLETGIQLAMEAIESRPPAAAGRLWPVQGQAATAAPPRRSPPAHARAR